MQDSTGIDVNLINKNYRSLAYDTKGRFASYWHQISEALQLGHANYLEVGIGSGLVSRELRARNVNVTTVDIDPRSGPDILGSVLALPLAGESFDAVLCFQVLEHLQFDLFGKGLAELARVARSHLILSLPDRRRHLRMEACLYPFFQRGLRFSLPHLKPPVHHFDGEHYWEIGKQGTSLDRVLKEFETQRLALIRHARVPEKPIHHLFVLQKARDRE